MYRIGEFSKITNLTIKALHYYDEIDLLKPSFVLENGYRYYNEDDYQKALKIQLLKTLGFSINEMKDVFLASENDDDFYYYLLEKKTKIQKQIKKQKDIIKMIDTYCNPIKMKGSQVMKYEISQVDLDEQLVAFIPFVGQYEYCSDYFPKLFKAAKSKVCGTPFNLYYDGEFKEQAHIETCVPIDDSFYVKGIKIKTLPKIQAIKTRHIGTYDSLHFAYKALIDYAKENDIECDIPAREVYCKGPGMFMKGNPEKYVTDIYIPIKKQ